MTPLYDKIYWGFKFFADKQNNKTAHDTAIVFVSLTQALHVMGFFLLLKWVKIYDVFSLMTSKYSVLIIAIPWIIISFIYYSRVRVKKRLVEVKWTLKDKESKTTAFSLVSLIIPVILIFIYAGTG